MAIIESPIWEIDTVIPVGTIQGLFTRLGASGAYIDPFLAGTVFADTGGLNPAVLDGLLARLDTPGASPVAASFTNATTSQQPLLRNTGLEFDGVDDRLSAGDIAGLEFGTSDFTIAVAIRPDVITGNHDIIGNRGANAPGSSPGWGMQQLDNQLRIKYDFPGNTTALYTLTTGITVSTWQTAIIQFNATTGEAIGYIDNVAGTPITIATGNIATDTPLALGSASSPANFFDGRIGRAVMIDQILSTADRTFVHDWLAEGYM